jgi:hypothetical protein
LTSGRSTRPPLSLRAEGRSGDKASERQPPQASLRGHRSMTLGEPLPNANGRFAPASRVRASMGNVSPSRSGVSLSCSVVASGGVGSGTRWGSSPHRGGALSRAHSELDQLDALPPVVGPDPGAQARRGLVRTGHRGFEIADGLLDGGTRCGLALSCLRPPAGPAPAPPRLPVALQVVTTPRRCSPPPWQDGPNSTCDRQTMHCA